MRKSEGKGKGKPRGSGKGRVATPLHVYEQKVMRDIEARELEMTTLDRDSPSQEKKYIELRKRNYSQYDRLRKRRGSVTSQNAANKGPEELAHAFSEVSKSMF